MDTEKKHGLGGVIEAVAKAAEKLGGKKPAEKSEHRTEKPQKQKEAAFIQAPQEMVDTFKQKLEQRADSKLVKQIKQRTQPRDQRVVSILNELLTVEESNKDYPHKVEAAARRLKDLALEFMSTKAIYVAEGGEVVAQDARRCLRELMEAYPEYKGKLEPLMLEAHPTIKGGAPTPPAPEVYNEADPTKETVITHPDLIQKLKDINYNLRINARYREDTHRLNNDVQEISKLKGIPEDQVEEAIKRVNILIKVAEHKGAGGASISFSDWIDEKDAHGNRVEPEDTYTDPSGATHDLRGLKDVLKELRGMGGIDDPRQWGRQFAALEALAMNPDGTPSPIADIVQPYIDRMDRTFGQLYGERLRLTPDMVHKMSTDSTYRDEQFYERLKKLLEEPDGESHHIMGLYEKHDMDAFMHAVSEMEVLGPDRKPVPEHERREITEDIRRMYQLRIDALMNFHDVDYWARHGSGDIKSFQGTVARIQNHQAKEVLSDPYVQTMRNCYEKALLFIRASHNGYIPPNLLSPDPLRHGRTYLDDVALEFFQAKVAAGELYDIRRDAHGRTIRDADYRGNVFSLNKKPMTLEDLEHQRLRVMAAQQIARGVLVLDMRTLEIIGMSKVPGFDHPEFGITEVAFSSKPYGQLARHFNIMAEWMGKYKMGVTLHVPYFQTLIEGKSEHFRLWNSNQWREVLNAVTEGKLEEKFGSKDAHARRLIDMIDEWSFSGRNGPMSAWGIHDSTIGWSDRDRERLGGSIRMAGAKEWAEEKIKKDYERENKGKGEVWIGEHWAKDKSEGNWKDEIDKLFKTKRAWLWVQTTMRHPTIVAGYLREKVGVPQKDKPLKQEYRNIRDRIIVEILGDELREILKDNKGIPDHLKDAGVSPMEQYYSISSRTPGDDQREFLKRVAQLEADVDSVQQRAMEIKTGKPRDITESDFDIITDEKRRNNAKLYWKKTQEVVLGSWSADKWYAELDVEFDGKGNVGFGKYRDIDKTLEDANKDSRSLICDKDLLTKSMMQHMSTEDVQWRFLDIETLGPPHWNRRVGDLGARIESEQKSIAFLDKLVANPDIPKLAEALREVYIAEKSHDPRQGHKLVWMLAKPTGELYRQDHWGRLIPFVGRVGSRVFKTSIAQRFLGTTRAAAWSANNERQWVDQFSDGATLPLKRFLGGQDWGPYNAQDLAKSLGGTWYQQALEFFLIGTSIAAAVTLLQAFTESRKEDQG
ncbi:MAG: hypothetical protein HY376_03880 [Candidatus Blackburnbacteria bacterium]|nr:hypothetical protein [Candidatus Blackburnbacteria bacterium]